MTEAQRRYMHARQRVEELMLNPATELLEATSALVQEAKQRAKDADEGLAQLRPIWAQGYTSDSQAAQALGNAVSELWGLLHATDQTQALENLRSLIAVAAEAVEYKRKYLTELDPRKGNY